MNSIFQSQIVKKNTDIYIDVLDTTKNARGREKVITVTLMRSDLYDAPAYSGAYLKLPASRDEIQDALHRARVTGKGNLAMHELINQTYNLDDTHAIPAKNDRELGKFYVDNDFIDAVNHVPPEYQQELLDLLDYGS